MVVNGNHVSPSHRVYISQSTTRVNTVMRVNPRVNNYVTVYSTNYYRSYHPVWVSHYNTCGTYYNRWSPWYRPWYRYGFYGGFYYPLNPVYDINAYFYNPVVFWLYADSWDDYYYNTWYGSDYYSYNDLRVRFQRPGVFYPTVAMRDLAVLVSSMPVRAQGFFRLGMNDLAVKLEQKLSFGLGRPVSLTRNDIVVTHFESLEAGAIVLEGFVSSAATQRSFKALIDLNDVNQNLAFVPFSQGTSADELYELRMLNERISYYGGVVATDATVELHVRRRGD